MNELASLATRYIAFGFMLQTANRVFCLFIGNNRIPLDIWLLR